MEKYIKCHVIYVLNLAITFILFLNFVLFPISIPSIVSQYVKL